MEEKLDVKSLGIDVETTSSASKIDSTTLLPTWGYPGQTFTLKLGTTVSHPLVVGRRTIETGKEAFFISVAMKPDIYDPNSLDVAQEIYWMSVPKEDLP